MSSQGPKIVGTGASVSTGNTPWTNPSNISANDGVFAVAPVAQGSPSPNSSTSDDLRGTNCGFSIPVGSTINGIQVDIFEKRDNAGGAFFGSGADASVKIIKGGTKQGNEKAANTNWLNAGSLFTYGGSSDLWGLSWTPADINASNFGCSLSAVDNTGLGINLDVDFMQVTVFFTPASPPSVTSVSANNGPISGGQNVTITGANFLATPTSITFGGAAATNIVFNSSTSVSCTTPAHAAGTVNVVVTNPDGQTGTGTNVFTFNPPPTVTSCSPAAGPPSGGNSVTITGTGFLATPTSITFGGAAATNIVFNSATSVSCTAPAHAVGTVNVVVTNPDGQSGTGTNVYTYNPPPSFSSCNPGNGPAAGGTSVTIS